MDKMVEKLLAKGVIIPKPEQVSITKDVNIENIEPEVVLFPGVQVAGNKTLLGKGTRLGKEYGGLFEDVCCGRYVNLGSGTYQDCVFLDGASTRTGAEIRNGTLFMEKASSAHTVGCKMTILGIHVTLGSLINFCDCFITGGRDEPFGFTEIGSGAIHYNFTPGGLKYASLIGSGVLGEMFGLSERVFIGGQTQIIAPTIIGSGSLIPAGVAVREVVPPGKLHIEAGLKTGQKDFYPELLTSVLDKFNLTAHVVFHYNVLLQYFETVRSKFAKQNNDLFLHKVYQRAQETINANIAERLSWLFDKKEDKKEVHFFAKLKKSLELHFAKLQGEKFSFHFKNIQEHQLLLASKDKLKEILLSSSNLVVPASLEQALAHQKKESYLDFIISLDPTLKEEGKKWLEEALSLSNKNVEQTLKRLPPRFHGTDGLRGQVICPDKPLLLKEAISLFLEKHQLTPTFFEALARNTIYAYEILFGKIKAIALARDTRDLYFDDEKRANVFYQAIKEGALSAGKKVCDLDITPIPNLCYVFAKLAPEVDIALYKTASHNPASQDGLKFFIRQKREQQEDIFVKPMALLEDVISALLVRESLWGVEEKTKLEPINTTQLAQDVFAQTMLDPKNLPSFIDCQMSLVCDLSNGAFSHSSCREILEESVEHFAKVFWVGASPDGKNINSNEGNQRVGAAHFENVQEISLEQKGEFQGFPVLQKLFELIAADDKQKFLHFASLVDGDGDRGIVMVYNPIKKSLQVFDGDKAIFLQLYRQVSHKMLATGATIAITVESNVPFLNAITKMLRSKYPVQLMLGEKAVVCQDKINIKITPVGDKYILKEQCFGGEASGHVIYRTSVAGENEKVIYTGNGFLANLRTIAAIGELLYKDDFSSDAFEFIAHPYSKPQNAVVYIYFVRKELWFYNSPLWKKVEKIVGKHCQNYKLKSIKFSQEPDTLYYCSIDSKENFEFTILARPSGTENKMGIKFYGTKEYQDLFDCLGEDLFEQMAFAMKDTNLAEYKDENTILELLAQAPEQTLTIDQLASQETKNDSIAKAHFMNVIGSLSEKGQKLATYDGTNLALTNRGKKYLQKSGARSQKSGEEKKK